MIEPAVLVLEDGTTRLAIVIVDSCMMPRDLLDEAKGLASRATGIPTSRMLISATHTHSAPEVGPPGVYKVLLKGRSDHEWDREYTEQISAALVKAVEQRTTALAGRVRFDELPGRTRPVFTPVSTGLSMEAFDPEPPVQYFLNGATTSSGICNRSAGSLAIIF